MQALPFGALSAEPSDLPSESYNSKHMSYHLTMMSQMKTLVINHRGPEMFWNSSQSLTADIYLGSLCLQLATNVHACACTL